MCLKCPTKAPPEAMVLVQVPASTLSQSASVGSHFTGNQIKLRCRAHSPVTSDPRAVTAAICTLTFPALAPVVRQGGHWDS